MVTFDAHAEAVAFMDRNDLENHRHARVIMSDVEAMARRLYAAGLAAGQRSPGASTGDAGEAAAQCRCTYRAPCGDVRSGRPCVTASLEAEERAAAQRGVTSSEVLEVACPYCKALRRESCFDFIHGGRGPAHITRYEKVQKARRGEHARPASTPPVESGTPRPQPCKGSVGGIHSFPVTSDGGRPEPCLWCNEEWPSNGLPAASTESGTVPAVVCCACVGQHENLVESPTLAPCSRCYSRVTSLRLAVPAPVPLPGDGARVPPGKWDVWRISDPRASFTLYEFDGTCSNGGWNCDVLPDDVVKARVGCNQGWSLPSFTDGTLTFVRRGTDTPGGGK